MRQIFLEQAPGHVWRGLWLDAVPISVQSYAVIRLHDAWARYCKDLVLVSTAGEVFTTTGRHIKPVGGIRSRKEALALLRSKYPKWRQRRTVWEPKWFDPRETIEAATLIGVGNLASMGALASAGVATEDLRDCRNFLAHRDARTNRAIDAIRRRVGVPMAMTVEDLANATVPGGATLFELWCYELRQKAMNAAK